MDTQSKGAMLTRRQLLLALVPAPLLLSTCHEQPAPPEPRVLPDQEARVASAFYMTEFGVYVFHGGPYPPLLPTRLSENGWTKISEAL